MKCLQVVHISCGFKINMFVSYIKVYIRMIIFIPFKVFFYLTPQIGLFGHHGVIVMLHVALGCVREHALVLDHVQAILLKTSHVLLFQKVSSR